MKKETFITRYTDCKKRPCFVPFRGNGVSICRLYETGQCKDLPNKGRKEMNTREEFEKFIADYDNYDFAFITEMWQSWQEQQKKIDELQLKLDIKDDAIRGYQLVIEELQKVIK